jgi:hypothetical protein
MNQFLHNIGLVGYASGLHVYVYASDSNSAWSYPQMLKRAKSFIGMLIASISPFYICHYMFRLEYLCLK